LILLLVLALISQEVCKNLRCFCRFTVYLFVVGVKLYGCKYLLFLKLKFFTLLNSFFCVRPHTE